MALRKQITKDLTTAMKSGDTNKRDTLRMLDSMIKNEEIAQGKREEGLNDDEVIVIVKRAIKQRRDSVTQYKNGGRDDLAAKEEEEITILKAYLPAQMSEDEVRNVVKEIITQTNATSKADMGKVMSGVMGKIGDKTNGSMVRKIVDEILQ